MAGNLPLAWGVETVDVNLTKGQITARTTSLDPGDYLNICSRDEAFHQPYSVSSPNKFGSSKAREKDLLSKGQCRTVEVKNNQSAPVEMTIYDRFHPKAYLVLKVRPKPQAPATKTEAKTTEAKKSEAKAAEDKKPPDPDTFAAPMQGNKRLAYCYAPDEGCGRKAADHWCQRKGYKGAKDWDKLPRDAAKPQPGQYIGSDLPCARGQCDTFESITCRMGPPTFF